MLSTTVTNTGGAAPSSITYQWYSRTTDSNVISGATQIPGANTSAFLPQFDTAGVLYYFCVATNAVGSTASNTVKVEIKGQGVPIPAPGGTVTIDNIEWRVLATDTTTPGGPYHLITIERAVAGTSVYNAGSSYVAYANQTTGGVRAAVNTWYAARGSELTSRAYMPNTLASETAYNTVQPAAMTKTNGTAAGATTADVAFLLSWSEASTYLLTDANRILRTTTGFGVGWSLRSPGLNSASAGFVNTNGPLFSGDLTTSRYLRPALWIK